MPVVNSDRLSIEGLLEILEKADPACDFYRGAAGVLDGLLVKGGWTAAAPAVHSEKKFLTIGMCTYDDYDGVYFSAQAIRLYHPEITAESEILVIDNHPGDRAHRRCRGCKGWCRVTAASLSRGARERRFATFSFEKRIPNSCW